MMTSHLERAIGTGGVKVRVKVVRLVCYACEDGSNATLK